jgi:hypothetical protein
MATKLCFVALLALLAPFTAAQDDNPCQVSGVDFQDGQSYFQNIDSTDPFTFVQVFVGKFSIDSMFNGGVANSDA